MARNIKNVKGTAMKKSKIDSIKCQKKPAAVIGLLIIFFGTISGVIPLVGSIASIYSVISDLFKSPKLELEIKSKTNFEIDKEKPFVEFRIYNMGDKPSKSLNYLYYFNNQSENSCNSNRSFFKSRAPLCKFTIKEGKEGEKYCQSDTPPAMKEAGNYFTIVYSFDNETAEFKNFIDSSNITNCRLKEFISICTYYNMEKTWCTKPVEYTIVYK